MKVILITGATAGIGLQCALQLAELGHHLILVGRNPDKLAAAEARTAACGASHVDAHLCDFSSLASVRSLTDTILSEYPRIDVLVNNAGTVHSRRTETVDGYEATFAVNHLAPYLLTERLKELMTASAPSRIVITASRGHYRATLDFDDLGYREGYGMMKAYYRSKLANVLYTRGLARELEGTGVTVNAVHPGMVSSDIWNGAPWFTRPYFALVKRFRMITPEEGGRRLTYLATDPNLLRVNGKYFEENTIKAPSGLAQDETVVRRLREISTDMAHL